MPYEYLTILLLLFAFSIFLEHKFHVHLYKTRKERIEITLVFFLIGIIWDSFAIWRGHWIFPRGHNVGLIIGDMPLEEYLFILVIPYMILTVYKILDSKFRIYRKK